MTSETRCSLNGNINCSLNRTITGKTCKMHLAGVLCAFLCFLAVFSDGAATLSKKDKKGKKKKEKTLTELPDTTVMERQLVTENPKWKDIVSNSQLYSNAHKSSRQFQEGTVLAYVTPWNNHGYDIAKWFAAKFTHISPVWLQLKRKYGGSFALEGTHDIDQGWLAEVRASSKDVKILPRLLFEGWSMTDYKNLFADEGKRREMAEYLVHVLKHHQFDGIVLEIWSQLGGHHKSELSQLVRAIADHLHSNELQTILVIPAMMRGSLFGKAEFKKLAPHVDGFSLMTYDYSRPGSPGATSPIDWVRECVLSLAPQPAPERRKILLGLNFYGYDFSTSDMEAIVGNRYLELVNKHKPKMKWDSHCAEHYFSYKVGSAHHEVYFPTLQSINTRLALAEELGTGISIWEVGQGLDYFYDLL